MSLYTFTDSMAEISLEVSEREIYNDIRSEVTISGLDTIIDQELEYAWEILSSGIIHLFANGSETITLTPTYPVIKWNTPHIHGLWGGSYLDDQSDCTAWGGAWEDPLGYPAAGYCNVAGLLSLATVYVNSRTETSTELLVVNSLPWAITVKVEVEYKYLYQPEESHTESWVKTVKVRRQDSDSIKKYGRRVMNLVWPLGQSKADMEATIEAYLDRHKEPMPIINMKVQGRTDALIEQIFTRKISDCVTVENTAMGMPALDFFINSASISQDTGDLLEVNWGLEQARDNELVVLFHLDVSTLDGTHVLAF